MRILGIDPGLRTTGFGVIEHVQGQLRYIASGTIQTTPGSRSGASVALPLRLKTLYEGIREVAQRYQPDCASVEIVFVNVNPQASLLLGQARGAAMASLAGAGLKVHEYATRKVKLSVVGTGGADKDQVAFMVRRLLPRAGEVSADAADALAVAICAAHHRPVPSQRVKA